MQRIRYKLNPLVNIMQKKGNGPVPGLIVRTCISESYFPPLRFFRVGGFFCFTFSGNFIFEKTFLI